ncbi:hypothetical protein DIU36_30760 [Mucilaginibacter rubeus]|nr:hypothetical protein DIU36_30760 [Mucilaginibacter rubeus]
MTESKFKTGDIVYLNSGIPPMTVVWVESDQTNVIFWNAQLNRFDENTFSTSCLYSS